MVVMDSALYKKLANKILSNTSTYRVPPSDPMDLFKSKLEIHLHEGLSLGVITQWEFKFMLPPYPVVHIYHGLPKTHKEEFPTSLCPIISGIGSLGEGLHGVTIIYRAWYNAPLAA